MQSLLNPCSRKCRRAPCKDQSWSTHLTCTCPTPSSALPQLWRLMKSRVWACLMIFVQVVHGIAVCWKTPGTHYFLATFQSAEWKGRALQELSSESWYSLIDKLCQSSSLHQFSSPWNSVSATSLQFLGSKCFSVPKFQTGCEDAPKFYPTMFKSVLQYALSLSVWAKLEKSSWVCFQRPFSVFHRNDRWTICVEFLIFWLWNLTSRIRY